MSVPQLSCNIVGDPDLYGLGVRLAVYSQALTYLCATTYSKSPRMILEIPCVLLNMAVNSVLALRAFQRRLRPFDTMLVLFTAGTLGVAAPLEENAEWERRGRTIGGKMVTWLQTACMVLQLGFGSWAVMHDMKVDFGSDTENCLVWIYLFSKQKNSGWALNVWKGFYGMSVSFLILRWIWRRRIVRDTFRIVWQGILQLWNQAFSSGMVAPPAKSASKTVEMIKLPQLAHSPLSRLPLARLPVNPQIREINNIPKSGLLENFDEIPARQVPAKQSSSRPDTAVLFSGLFWAIFFNVLGCELMIYWNNVQGVDSLDSSGQILSLLGGTFTLGQFVWALSGLSLSSEM